MKKVKSGGGWPAIRYALKTARESGGILKFYRAMRSRNACKTCALGMGGQAGGMVNETGHFPEVCKKSMQAMAADMQERITPDFLAANSIDKLRSLSPRELENLGRLVEPLYAGPEDTHLRAISWEDALDRCVKQLKQTPPDRNFFYVSGRSSNEAGFLWQLFARLYGTNNVNNCSYYCHQASGVGLQQALGVSTATVVLEDLDRCDCVFLIGANPASNHPRLMRALMKVRRRGGQVIVVNPMIETGLVNFSVPSDPASLLFGSKIASHYVQPHIGGDVALLVGIAKRLDETNRVDEGFLAACTDGWETVQSSMRAITWDEVVNASGVDRATINQVADFYANSKACIFAWAMGITHHRNGSDNVQAIANLALLRGMIGKPGAGMMPIRGHSNVQGIGSVGVTPALKKAFFDALEDRFDVRLPTSPGLDTLACLAAMLEDRLTSGWCLGGNLYGATPDALRAGEAIAKLDSMVYFSTTLNTGHVHGRARETLILPMLARDEEPQKTTQESMFSFVRLSDGGPARHVGPRSEVETIATIARSVLGDDGPVDWRSMQVHKNIRQAIGAVVPAYERTGRIDETEFEFQISGRTFHEARFPTENGKARLRETPIPRVVRAVDELMLMTVRSEGQFNTVVYEEEDLYRGQDRRDVLLMSEADMQRMGLVLDQLVMVRSAVGEMKDIRVRPFDIRAGNAAMYFPEANALVPWHADPKSRTPAYKAVTITLSPQENASRVSR